MTDSSLENCRGTKYTHLIEVTFGVLMLQTAANKQIQIGRQILDVYY